MRILVITVLSALVLAGCASPEPAPEPSGPIDLSGKLGLLAIDVDARRVTVLSERPGPAWVSPSGAWITWFEGDYAVLLQTPTDARQIVKATGWARIHDNGTGLALTPGTAEWRELVGGNVTHTVPVPEAPVPGAGWTGASADLSVLGGEYATANAGGCARDIYLRAEQSQRTTGCHLRVAADGRAGWTEATGVRLREANGTVRFLTPTGGGDIPAQQFVSNENPVFTADGVVHLRMTGGQQLRLSEVVREDGSVIAKMDGTTRLALHDVSADGRLILVGSFTR